MGFFNSLLKGLGFESDDQEKKPKQKQKKAVKAGEYSLEDEKKDAIIEMCPKNQAEVEKTIDLLKKEGKVIVDLSQFGDMDKNLALQFLSGACYAVNGEIVLTEDNKYKLWV